MGRPSIFTPELGASICERIALGESLRAICREDGMPAQRTVLEWLSQDEDFRAKCARAREDQADSVAERVLDTADLVEQQRMEPDAARVVISALQWTAAKLKPKKYGERQTVEHEGQVDFAIRVPVVAGSVTEWVAQAGQLSGSHNPAPKPSS